MKGHGRILREVERTLAGIPAVIRYKNIKNLYLRVSADGSRIELSVPRRTLLCDMEDFVRHRRAWIEARLRSMRAKKPPSLYAAGDIVHLWGKACHIADAPLVHGKAYAEWVGGMIVLHAPVDADARMRRAAVDALCRRELTAAIEREAPHCEAIVGKHAERWRIRAMKTRWGSCNVRTAYITLNLQLVQYDVRALRYVMMHELTHLWVRGHNAQFYARMDRYFPDWREVKKVLNTWARENSEMQ